MIAITACLLLSTAGPVIADVKKAEMAFPKTWNSFFHKSVNSGKPLLKSVDAHPTHPKFQSTGSSESGWAYTLQYKGSSCDADQAIVSSALATNQCFVSPSSTTSQPTTVMITCDGNQVVSHLYNSENCNPQTEVGTEKKDLNTCAAVNQGDSIYVDAAMQQTFCVSAASGVYPVPAGNWVILNEYGQKGCQQNQNYFTAVKDNTCYKTQLYDDNLGFTTYNAFQWNYPSYTNYYDTTPRSIDAVDCTSSTFTTNTVKDTTCRDESNVASDEFSTNYNPLGYSDQLVLYTSNGGGLTSAPTFAPSAKPSEAPTAAPTMKVIGHLTFTSEVTLSGVTDTTLFLESQQAILDAAASVMNIPATNVGYVSARSTSDGIIVTISIETPVSSVNDVPVLYSQLTSVLLSSVNSGFADALKSASEKHGATQLASAQVSEVTYSASKFVKSDGTSTASTASTATSSSNSLSAGAIAGVVIAAFFFFIITAGFAYYYNSRYLKEQRAEEERLQAEEASVANVSVNVDEDSQV